MDIKEIVDLLKAFRWATLERMYGCAHSWIIGFISTEWINQSEDNSILDGACSPSIGKGRPGQKNADIILCKGDRPFIAVEIETLVDKYSEKVESLSTYLDNTKDFNGIEFGLLFMTNLTKGDMKYKHCWDTIKMKIKEKNETITHVSINKVKVSLYGNALSHLRKRNDYYPWDIVKIDYRVHKKDQPGTAEGNLWKK